MLKSIIDQLGMPDDQGRDWYGWATNQCAHGFLGVITALLFSGAPIQMTLILALLKEAADLLRVTRLRTVRDSAQDIAFALLGACLVIAGDLLPAVVIVIVFFLLLGIIPRARKALREVKNGNDHQ